MSGWMVAALGVALLAAGAVFVLLASRREVNRVRRVVATGVSHELRTPLAQIRMFTEMLLLQRERSEEERMRWLEMIERDAQQLSNVMENLLLYVHGDEPDPFPARRTLDLGDLVEDIVAEFASRAAASGSRIELDPPGGVGGVAVLADPHAVRQAIANLLDNALRFGPAGQVVTVSLHADEGQAIVGVADEGPGVPMERRRADRRRFSRPAARQEGDGGGGFGLAVARRVAGAHGGSCGIGCTPAGGAQLSLTFPRVAPDSTNPIPRSK